MVNYNKLIAKYTEGKNISLFLKKIQVYLKKTEQEFHMICKVAKPLRILINLKETRSQELCPQWSRKSKNLKM